jgi:hypothetical protein
MNDSKSKNRHTADVLPNSKEAQNYAVASSSVDTKSQSMNISDLKIPVRDGALVDRVSSLIEQTRSIVTRQANAALTLMNWHIGRMIDVEVLNESRAEHATELVASLAQQLTAKFGRGFDRTNLYRMVRFSQVYPDSRFVASLAQQVL